MFRFDRWDRMIENDEALIRNSSTAARRYSSAIDDLLRSLLKDSSKNSPLDFVPPNGFSYTPRVSQCFSGQYPSSPQDSLHIAPSLPNPLVQASVRSSPNRALGVLGYTIDIPPPSTGFQTPYMRPADVTSTSMNVYHPPSSHIVQDRFEGFQPMQGTCAPGDVLRDDFMTARNRDIIET